MRSQRWASALIACHRFWADQPSTGRRKLFDAVNEAFCWLAKESHS